MKRFVLTLLLGACFFTLFAQHPFNREMRGAWVATVNNIDYPSAAGLTPEQQRTEWINLLGTFKKMGLNTVVVQVRAASDALYPTTLAPWSRFLTGTEGQEPTPYYDPLQFMIETAHERGFEFHAWLNPYRATTGSDTTKLAMNHVFYKHRNWIKYYGGKYYLNPALPEVRQHIGDIVADIVSRYAVDAIHFDDYFYPYKAKDEIYNDAAEYQQYGINQGFSDVYEFRRSNVNALILYVSQRIKEANPDVQFGISPFAVWRNKSTDPIGSDTQAGIQSYDDQSADVRYWLSQGWIDYVVPQNYWHIGFTVADHAKVTDWWSKNSFGRNLYMGLAAYKVGDDKQVAWLDPNELSRQVELNRQTDFVEGVMFYNTSSLIKNKLSFRDSIENRAFGFPAIWPAHIGPYLQPAHPFWKRFGSSNHKPAIVWRTEKANDEVVPYYYAIYRSNGRNADVFSDSNLLAITPIGMQLNRFVDTTAIKGQVYTYQIVSLSRHHVAGQPSEPRTVKVGALLPWGRSTGQRAEPTKPNQTPTTDPTSTSTTKPKPAPATKKCSFFKRLFKKCTNEPAALPPPRIF
jgi:uncharacterized lipoprotein YddW (UPF0748 family)